jgi:hypothetical protein
MPIQNSKPSIPQKPGQFGVKGTAGQDNKPSFFAPKITQGQSFQKISPYNKGPVVEKSKDPTELLGGKYEEQKFYINRKLRKIGLKEKLKKTEMGSLSGSELEDVKKRIFNPKYGPKISERELNFVVRGLKLELKKTDPWVKPLEVKKLKKELKFIKRVEGNK